MAIELKQTMKMSQQLVITPQLQQAIKLLQLSTLELSALVQQEILENPVLEEIPETTASEPGSVEVKTETATEEPSPRTEEKSQEVGGKEGDLKEPADFDWENYLDTYNAHIPSGPSMRSTDEEFPSFETTLVQKETLPEHLMWQLTLTPLSPEDEKVGAVIIGNINDDGYLVATVADMAARLNVPETQVTRVLKTVQGFDPLGVGASDLKECLILQARLCGDYQELVVGIIQECLPLLEKKDYAGIARRFKIPVSRAIHAAQLIADMEPKPGRPYGGEEAQYITPDIHVHKIGSEFVVVLNEDGLPKLQISNFYRNMLNTATKSNSNNKGAKNYIQDKLKNAVWLIRSIHQRQRTLYRVTKSILKFQKDFFERGVTYLKPLILREVADDIGVHESTVSRATSNKYVHTSHGIFELKFFFNSGITATMGDNIASEAVKAQIRHLVADENHKRPLSDQAIVDMLKKSNIDIARRTVAKYRENLRILPSSRRRQMF